MEEENNRFIYVEDTLLDDGYGNKHSRVCPKCSQNTMYIHSPDDFRCRLCYTENWVSIPLEEVLQSISNK